MTLTLTLSPEMEQRLTEEAQRQGVAPEKYALRLLENQLSRKDRYAELRALLKSWREEDPQEQKETGDYLVRVLDEDRLGDRPLFPPELEGITW